MANQTLSPDALLDQTGLTGSLTDIQDDPDSPDANWLTTSNNTSTVARVSFPTPSGDLTVGAGLQEFRVLVRKTNHSTNPTCTVDLYENGSLVTNLVSSTTISTTSGIVLSGTWNASSLSNINGSLVECRVVGTPGSGNPSNRASVEVGAIEWNAVYTTSSQVVAQASAYIKRITPVYSQAQADIKQTYNAFAQANASILQVYRDVAQAQAYIKLLITAFAQAQADIKQVYNVFAQAQGTTKQLYLSFAQGQAWIVTSPFGFAQAQAVIGVTDNLYTAVDELIADDTDFITTNLLTGSFSTKLKLTSISTPNWPIQHIIKVRALSFVSATLTVGLYEGITLIASFQPSLTSTFTTFSYSLTPAEIASITNYTDLYLVFDSTDRALVSSAQFIVPSTLTTTTAVFAQAQANILITKNGFAQAQADILQTYKAYAQSQADIVTTYFSVAQAQGTVINGSFAYAQALAKIIKYLILVKDTFTRVQSVGDLGTPDIGPAYATTGSTNYNFISADGSKAVLTGNNNYDYVVTNSPITEKDLEASIDFRLSTINDWFTPIQLDLRVQTSNDRASGYIAYNPGTTTYSLNLTWVFDGLADSIDTPISSLSINTWYTFKLSLLGNSLKGKVYSQGSEPVSWDLTLSTVPIRYGSVGIYADVGEAFTAPTTIEFDNYNIFQDLAASTQIYAQALASIATQTRYVSAQARAHIKINVNKSGQAKTSIKQTYSKVAQAQAFIIKLSFAQAQSYILAYKVKGFGQALSKIISTPARNAQAQAFIIKGAGYANAIGQIISNNNYKFAQANAIITKAAGYGQAKTQIIVFGANKGGQAQANIVKSAGNANAQAFIRPVYRSFAQAASHVQALGFIVSAQAQAYITYTWATGQAQAYIGSFKVGQAQAKIKTFNTKQYAHAQAYISGKYLVNYNNFELPGYAKAEDFSSDIIINKKYSPYMDEGLSEAQGLTNKPITVKMIVTGDTYLHMKQQVQKAATIVRSGREFKKLYIQKADHYYLAIAKKITTSKTVTDSLHVLEYEIEFEAKPWLYSNTIYVASGVGLITIPRTLDDGGWSYANLTVTGTNVTISGYTSNEPYTGFISISGAVNNLVINSEQYTTTNTSVMLNKDYRLYIGPETTYITVSGASECVITYQNRYYL